MEVAFLSKIVQRRELYSFNNMQGEKKMERKKRHLCCSSRTTECSWVLSCGTCRTHSPMFEDKTWKMVI